MRLRLTSQKIPAQAPRPRETARRLRPAMLTAALAASCVSLALGCSAGAEDGENRTNEDDITGDEANEATTPEQEPSAPSDARLAPEFAELVVSSTGSPFVTSPPGSECDASRHLHTLAISSASRSLSWDLCARPSAEAPLELQRGARILGSDELDAIAAAYAGMTLRSGPACGTDAPFIWLDVTIGGGIERYADERQCPPTPYTDRAYVSGVLEFWTALRDLVP